MSDHDKSRERKVLYPILGITVLIIVVTLVVITIITNILNTAHQNFGSQQTLPPATQQPLQPTNLQQVEAVLGPFSTLPASNSSTPDTQYPAVLMIRQDGSIGASSNWSVPFNTGAGWTQQSAGQIVSLTVMSGFATFSTGPGRSYTVKCNQSFVLEQDPQYVYVITSSSMQYSISSARAEVLRQHI